MKEYADEGCKYAVCLDLSIYFDTLIHELFMNMLRKDIKDKMVIELIKRYLKSGAIENGIVMNTNVHLEAVEITENKGKEPDEVRNARMESVSKRKLHEKAIGLLQVAEYYTKP